jgi:formate hydrogenlyase subunit 3/multisubunit Na+/H+ antiporter MnhD subunit
MNIAILNTLDYYYFFLIFAFLGIAISMISMVSKKFKNSFVVVNILYMAASLTAVLFSLGALISGHNGSKLLFTIGSFFPAGNINFCLDPLSAFFILFSFAVFFYISLYQIRYIDKFKTKLNPDYFSFLFGIMLVSVFFTLISFNAFIFMISWEIMAISSYFLVIGKHYIKGTKRAAFLMATIMEIGGMLIMAGIMLLYVHSNSFGLSALKEVIIPPALKEIIFLLFLFGFGAKMGIVPLHIWLPEAHPAALSSVSAILSGVLTSAGVYGLIRFGLYVLHPMNSALFLGTITLIIAAITMFFGVIYMAQTHDIKVLLSYSTVENMGLILTGIGASMYYKFFGFYGLSALALIASLYALINHAFFKSLLFMGAGNIEYDMESHDMDQYGGILKRMPVTGALIFIGVMAAAAMPPLNGFVSEWLNLEVIFLGFNIHSIFPRIILFSAGAVLALTVALAIGNYVKLYGVTFLGSPRSKSAKNAKEVPLSMNIAMFLPVLLNISLVGFMFFYTNIMSKVSNLIYKVNISKKIMHNGIFIPYYSSFSASSPIYLFLVSILFLLILFLIYLIVVKPKKRNVQTAWQGGMTILNPHAQISALGFSNAIRIMFSLIYRPRKRLEERLIYPLHDNEGKKLPSNPFPYSSYYHNSSGYGSYVFPLVEYYLYLPVIKLFNRLSSFTTSILQNGSLNLYIFYIFFVFLAALLIIVR